MVDFPNLHNKRFKAIDNSVNGDVKEDTVFHYRQKDNIIWATYEGGDIIFGTLSGERNGNELLFSYQHRDVNGVYKSGKCNSIIESVKNKIRLIEKWEWTGGAIGKGESILIEV